MSKTLETNRISDPVKAQAAIAFLISQGWQIDLAKINNEIPGGLNPNDWLSIANGCMDWVMNKIAEEKVIPISRFRH